MVETGEIEIPQKPSETQIETERIPPKFRSRRNALKRERAKRTKIEERAELISAQLSSSEAQREVAERNSLVDPLTELPNRRFFEQELENRIRERKRSGRDFYLLFMDVDDFKKYNSQYTHAGGDKILKVYRKVNEGTRPREGVIRLAGDEFVQFVDSEVTEEGLLEVSQRNQRVFREEAERALATMEPVAEIKPDEIRRSAGISIGLVKFQSGMSSESLIALSSAALLKAKSASSGIVITDNGQEFRTLENVSVSA